VPTTEGSKTTEILVALLMKAVGLALVIFASLKVEDPVLKAKLIEIGFALFGAGGVSYIVGRSVRKIGQPTLTPGDDAEAAKVVAGTK
jgi:hypothetical protein